MVDRDKANERVCGTDAAKGGVAERVIAEDVADVSATRVWRTFASYYRPYRALFVFDLVCATVLACVDLAFPSSSTSSPRIFSCGPRIRSSPPSVDPRALHRLICGAHGLPVLHHLLGGTSWARAWKPTCGATCSSSTNV